MVNRLVIIVALSLCAAASSGAQTTRTDEQSTRTDEQPTPTRASVPRPYRGLFGPAERDEKRPARVTLMMSIYGGRDDNTSFDNGGALDEELQAGRMFQGAQAMLGFRRRRPRSTFTVDLSSALRYYSDLRSITTQKHSAAVRMIVAPTKKVNLDFAQSIGYSPSYQLALGVPMRGAAATAPFSLAPSDDPQPDLGSAGVDYSVARQKLMAYGWYAGLKYVAGPNQRFGVDYALRYDDFLSRPDFSTMRIAAQYTRRLSSAVDLRLGYGLGTATLAGSAQTRHHDIDIGLNYRRAFSFSPRTSIGFTSGSTVVSTGAGQHFELVGSLGLRHKISARWVSEIGYQRGLQMIDSLPRPFVADALNGSVAGYLTSRLSLRVTPSFSKGVDVSDPSRAYRSWVGQTRLDAAVNRHWAIYVEHFYYNYQFQTGIALPPYLAAGLDRQGLRWGLALWAPLSR